MPLTFPHKPPLWVPGLNRRHPLARNLELCMPMIEPGNATSVRPWDYAGRALALASSDRQRIRGRFGYGAYAFAGTDNPIDFAYRPGLSGANYTAAVLIEGVTSTVDGTNMLMLSCKHDDPATRNWQISWYQVIASGWYFVGFRPYFTDASSQGILCSQSGALTKGDAILCVARSNSDIGRWTLDTFSSVDGHTQGNYEAAKTAKSENYPLSFGDYYGATGWAGTFWPQLIDAGWYWSAWFPDAWVHQFARDIWALNRYPRHMMTWGQTGFGTKKHYRLYMGEGGASDVDLSEVVGLADPADSTVELLDGVSQPEGQYSYALRACSVGHLESTPVYETVDVDGEGCYEHLTAPEIRSVTAKAGGMVEVKFYVADMSADNDYQILAGQTVADLAVETTVDGGSYSYTEEIGPLADGRWQIRLRTIQGGRQGPLSPPHGVRADGTAPADPGTIIEIEQAE